MSKSAGRLKQWISQAVTVAKRCHQMAGQVRVLHGPGKNAPANLMRASMREWHQLTPSEQSAFNEIDYRCERFGAGDDLKALTSIFMQRPAKCSRQQPTAVKVDEVKSVEAALPSPQVQKQQKD